MFWIQYGSHFTRGLSAGAWGSVFTPHTTLLEEKGDPRGTVTHWVRGGLEYLLLGWPHQWCHDNYQNKSAALIVLCHLVVITFAPMLRTPCNDFWAITMRSCKVLIKYPFHCSEDTGFPHGKPICNNNCVHSTMSINKLSIFGCPKLNLKFIF